MGNDATSPAFFRRSWTALLTARRTALLLLALGVIALVLLAVHSTARGILFREYRNKTRQIAEMVASKIYAPDLAGIDSPDDVTSFAFRKVLSQLREVKDIYDDLAFVYILRRNAGTGEWTFVVDANPFDVDRDGDGVISPAEEGVLPGTEYPEARSNPRILAALDVPTAEEDFTTDYWGTFVSGYAPIVDPYTGESVAVLGVDVTRATFEAKYRAVELTTLGSFFILVGLITFAFFAYFGKSEALRVARMLEDEVGKKNVALEETVNQLLERESTMNRELLLAREIQEGFLPREFPLEERVRFAADYRACAQIGGDLYDTFPITDRSAGFYMADVVGHGVSAALVTAALKATIERSRQNVFQQYYPTVDLQAPVEQAALEKFLVELNRSIDNILPRNSFLTILVGIILPEREEIILGNAGHPVPVLWEKRNQRVRIVPVPSNLAIGIQENTNFRVVSNTFRPEDKLIAYTDGILERMNPEGESYGMDRLLRCVRQVGHLPPDELLRTIAEDTEQFSRGQESHDDEALLVIELLDSFEGGESGTETPA
jgi:serine phosphatase RsbU (regulator of sigma subunit)